MDSIPSTSFPPPRLAADAFMPRVGPASDSFEPKRRCGATRWRDASDTYFCRGEAAGAAAPTPGLRAYRTLMETDRKLRLHDHARIRRLSLDEAAGVSVLCSHDEVELGCWRRGASLQ